MATYKYLTEEEQQSLVQGRIQQAERQLFDAQLNRDVEVAALEASNQDENSKAAQVKAYDNSVAIATARLKAAQALETKK